MSIDEKENQAESGDQAIHVTNCTIYVGRVQIVLDPHLNADVTGIAETRAIEVQDRPAANTSLKQTDFIGGRSTKPSSQHQSIAVKPCTIRPKTATIGPTSRQPDCLRSVTSQPSCCLHCRGRCEKDAQFGAGSDNCIAVTDDCNAAVRLDIPSRRNSRRLPIRRTIARSYRQTQTKIPVPCSSRPELPKRQDRPVDLYAGSRLPVPIRPGPAPARVPRIDQFGNVRPPPCDDDRHNRRCVTEDSLSITEDSLHSVVDIVTVVESGQPCVRIDESTADSTSELQALDDGNLTGSQTLSCLSTNDDCRVHDINVDSISQLLDDLLA